MHHFVLSPHARAIPRPMSAALALALLATPLGACNDRSVTTVERGLKKTGIKKARRPDEYDLARVSVLCNADQDSLAAPQVFQQFRKLIPNLGGIKGSIGLQEFPCA